MLPDVSVRSWAQLWSLAGRTAVVTGGGRGIGAAISRRLAEAGAAVVIGDRDLAAAERTVEGIVAAGGSAIGMHADVRDHASVSALADAAVAAHGAIAIWVNNAGSYPTQPALEVSADDWDDTVRTNLLGTLVGAREAARHMATGGGGVIVNLSSATGFRARGAGLSAYTAAKHGVQGLTRSLAHELGPAGIRVLAVAPSSVRTPGTTALRDRVLVESGVDIFEQIGAGMPLRRVGEPDDVARAVVFCASDCATFMSGSTVFVDAGLLAV